MSSLAMESVPPPSKPSPRMVIRCTSTPRRSRGLEFVASRVDAEPRIRVRFEPDWSFFDPAEQYVTEGATTE
jgi:hypothetical protein